jgi:hypothetical protein
MTGPPAPAGHYQDHQRVSDVEAQIDDWSIAIDPQGDIYPEPVDLSGYYGQPLTLHFNFKVGNPPDPRLRKRIHDSMFIKWHVTATCDDHITPDLDAVATQKVICSK